MLITRHGPHSRCVLGEVVGGSRRQKASANVTLGGDNAPPHWGPSPVWLQLVEKAGDREEMGGLCGAPGVMWGEEMVTKRNIYLYFTFCHAQSGFEQI